MAQPAARLVDAQNLFIHQSVPSLFHKEEFNTKSGQQSIFRRKKSIAGFLELTGNFFYVSRLRVTFNVTENFIPHFGLIKGLIEFNRSKEVSFWFNNQEKTIEFDIPAKNQQILEAFLENIHALLENESIFKARLKSVLEFERRYAVEKKEYYRSILNR